MTLTFLDWLFTFLPGFRNFVPWYLGWKPSSPRLAEAIRALQRHVAAARSVTLWCLPSLPLARLLRVQKATSVAFCSSARYLW
jgi:hypothetical protein